MSSGITLIGGVEVSERAARAHEMKNCMSVILAVSRLVVHELSHESRVRMGRLESATQRLRDLLAADLAESVTADTRACGQCCVRALIDQTVERVADRAAEANVEVRVQCGGGELLCNEGALQEALFNLVANAIGASPPGHGVFVATYVTREGDQYWVVRDTGRGISSDRMAAIGRPFQSTKAGGSGLGLAVARSAIQAHGGLLHIESSVAAGTTVSVWLPRDASVAANQQEI